MEDLRFKNKKEYKRFLTDYIKFEEQGKDGLVYHNEDIVIKELYSSFDITDKILKFRDLSIRNFYFPLAGIYINDKLIGCVSKYAKGETLKRKKLYNENINIIIKAINELSQNIETLSKERIRTNDVNLGNILFENGSFNFIDTLKYYYSNETSENINYLNLCNIIPSIYNSLFPENLKQYLEDFCFKYGNNYENFFYSNPNSSILRIINILESVLNESFETFEEADKKMLIKKIY